MDKRILVIDDMEDVRKSFAMALEDLRYQLDTAESGEKGLDLVKDHHYDLIFLDLKMPGMNGIETLKKLRKTEKDVPVYIITAFYREFLEQLKSVQEDGISFEIVEKPIGRDSIINITKGILEGTQIKITGEPKYKFEFYISGQTQRSLKAVKDLKTSLEAKLKGQYSLGIMDVLESPQSAFENVVIGTPTLIKTSPPPEQRFIGDFSKGQFLKLL